MNILLQVWKSRFNLPRKVFSKLIKFYAKKFAYCQVAVKNQSQLFESINLNRAAGLSRLNEVTEQVFNLSYSEDNGMFSEHLILFAAIAQSKVKISSILEIGTFDGRTAVILGKLFPQAIVTTIDLPDGSSEFIDTYERNKSHSDFVIRRNDVLSSVPNIKFKQVNSLWLANWVESFDLIWIDGAHGYPVVPMDIINSYRLCNKGGFVLIDDIFVTVNNSDSYYKSVGGFETLTALKVSKLITDFILFNKRLGGHHNLSWEKKYVGLFQKK